MTEYPKQIKRLDEFVAGCMTISAVLGHASWLAGGSGLAAFHATVTAIFAWLIVIRLSLAGKS
jgi:uncharacterized protein (UPF0264 family)